MSKEAPSESFELNLNLDEEHKVSDFEIIASKFEQTRARLEPVLNLF